MRLYQIELHSPTSVIIDWSRQRLYWSNAAVVLRDSHNTLLCRPTLAHKWWNYQQLQIDVLTVLRFSRSLRWYIISSRASLAARENHSEVCLRTKRSSCIWLWICHSMCCLLTGHQTRDRLETWKMLCLWGCVGMGKDTGCQHVRSLWDRAGNTVDAACRSIEEHCSSEACWGKW